MRKTILVIEDDNDIAGGVGVTQSRAELLIGTQS